MNKGKNMVMKYTSPESNGQRRKAESKPITDEAMLLERYEFEQEILGIAIDWPEVIPKIVASISHNDLADEATRRVFRVIEELSAAEMPVTLTTMTAELKQRIDGGATWYSMVGGLEFLKKVWQKANRSNLDYIIHMIRRHSRRATLREAAVEMIAACSDMSVSEDEIVAQFEKSVTLAAAPISTTRTLAEAAQLAIDIQRESIQTGQTLGFDVGFPRLHKATGGFRRGQLILLSGRSYTGKTTLALNMAVNLAMAGHKTVFRCLEMKDFELAERVLCSLARFRLSQFARSDFDEVELEEAEQSIESLRDVPMWLPDATQDSVATIAAKAKYHKSRYGLDVLFVDHLQRLDRLPHHRHDQQLRFHLNESANKLKNLARALDCAVVLLTQLKIPDAGKEDNEPTEADYSESRQIITEADIAMLLHRTKDQPSARLIVNKVRRNREDGIDLNFDGPHQVFSESAKQKPNPNRFTEFDEFAGDRDSF